MAELDTKKEDQQEGEYDNYDTLNDQPIEEPIEGVDEDELKNYAGNDEVEADVATILDNIELARNTRKSKVEDDWSRYRDIYNCRRTTAYYNGRSKLFLGAARKAVDTLARIAREAILSDPYLSVETDIPQWQQVGSDFMRDMIERQGKIKQVVPIFLRQLFTLGTSCIKLGFKKECRKVKYRVRGSGEISDRKIFTHYGPTYEVVDMAKVYVWPETAVDFDGLKIVFEDATTDAECLRKLADEGIYNKTRVEEAIANKQKEIAERNSTNSQATQELGKDTTNEEDIDVCYAWALFQLPGQEEPQWNLITLSGDVILQIIENPWWFQLPPYLFGAIFREVGYFYGHGIIENLEMWQYMLNDMANQTMDVGTFTLNPIIAFDPALVDDPDLINMEPGGKVPVPPDSIHFERPPAQMSMEGLQMVRFLLNIIQEGSDANALVQGAPREGLGKAAGTATGVSQLFAAANSAVMDQVEDLEQQVFTPLLQNTEIMIHQRMDEKMIIRMTGPDGVVLTERIIEPSDLVLSTDLKWVASLRLKEKSAKAQQALNFLNIAVGVDPNLASSQGFRINLKKLIKDVYAGLGLPDVEDIVQDITYSLPGIPPDMETTLLEAGQRVVASPVDNPQNHQAHLQAHMMYQPKTELARVRMQEHIASHLQAMHEAEMKAQMMMQEGGMPQGGSTQGMAQGGMMMGSQGGAPLRPQEQPQYSNEGAAGQGILSQVGAGQ